MSDHRRTRPVRSPRHPRGPQQPPGSVRMLSASSGPHPGVLTHVTRSTTRRRPLPTCAVSTTWREVRPDWSPSIPTDQSPKDGYSKRACRDRQQPDSGRECCRERNRSPSRNPCRRGQEEGDEEYRPSPVRRRVTLPPGDLLLVSRHPSIHSLCHASTLESLPRPHTCTPEKGGPPV